jgi:hypothetical protein
LAASATPDREIRLPPLSNYARRLKPADGVTVLLQTASGDPVVVAGPVGRGRVVYAVGSGFWRLELFGAGLGDTGVDLGAFWQAATRWLAAAPASGRVRSSPEQPVYRAGETAAVIAEVYDELNEPLDNVVVTVGLQPGNRDVTMEGVGAGRYRATWSGLDPGEYSYRIDVRDPTDGTSQGRFVVESQSVEAMDLRADPALLVNLAATSGGEYRPLERWRDLQSRLKPPPRLIREERRLSATIHQGTWLVLCVVLLTAEWLLRKRSGML